MKENRQLKNCVKTLREIIVKQRADLRKYQTKGKNTTCSTWAIVVTPLNTIYPYIWSFSDFDIQV